jgi:hypothetical protein
MCVSRMDNGTTMIEIDSSSTEKIKEAFRLQSDRWIVKITLYRIGRHMSAYMTREIAWHFRDHVDIVCNQFFGKTKIRKRQ